MIEFITLHIETLSSIVTILGGMGAMIGLLMRHLDKKLERIYSDIKDLKQEQLKFHTRLTFLDGYIMGHDVQDRDRK